MNKQLQTITTNNQTSQGIEGEPKKNIVQVPIFLWAVNCLFLPTNRQIGKIGEPLIFQVNRFLLLTTVALPPFILIRLKRHHVLISSCRFEAHRYIPLLMNSCGNLIQKVQSQEKDYFQTMTSLLQRHFLTTHNRLKLLTVQVELGNDKVGIKANINKVYVLLEIHTLCFKTSTDLLPVFE